MNRSPRLIPILVALLLVGSVVPRPVAAENCAQPDRPARLLHLAKPTYPMLAMQVGAHGTFPVHVTLSKTGKVLAASVPAIPHPYAGLDQNAVAAARNSTYAPALMKCVPVDSTLTVPVKFPPPN